MVMKKMNRKKDLCLELKHHLRNGEAFFTKQEVADQLKCTIRCIEKYIAAGELLAFKRGSEKNAGVLIPEFAIRDFLRQSEINKYFS